MMASMIINRKKKKEKRRKEKKLFEKNICWRSINYLSKNLNLYAYRQKLKKLFLNIVYCFASSRAGNI